MRQRKTFTLLALVMAVMLLGIAYAAIQNVTLSVAGNVTATPDQGNFKVGFTGTYSLTGLTRNGGGSFYIYDESMMPVLYESVPNGSYAPFFAIDVKGLNGVGDKGTITLTVTNGSTDIASNLEVSAEFEWSSDRIC